MYLRAKLFKRRIAQLSNGWIENNWGVKANK